MSAREGLVTATALLLAWSAPGAALAAGFDDMQQDGWYTWRAASVAGAPSICCLRWNGGIASPGSCSLDGGRNGMSLLDGDEHRLPDTGEVQLYARLKSGAVTALRSLSPACAVESESPVTDLGAMAADASVAWLRRLIDGRNAEAEDALMAIAMHAGDTALDYVTAVALDGEYGELREDAVFWLGQVRIDESRDTIARLMFEDPDDDMREHAAFSLAQSGAADTPELLIRQGREDRSPEVRSQAWFWLAQSGSDAAEAAIFNALHNDPDADVREEAVFALAQLPGEQAVQCLLQVLADRSLDRDIREQALFWLADSDSDSAYEAIDRLLSRR